MPARNAAATLSRALESLTAQTYADWEAVVVDDGSTDETGEIAREWARREPRIRVLEQPGAGVSAARNTGVATAQHPLLLFLDADDEILPRALEVLVGTLEESPWLVGVYGRWARVTPAGRVIELYPAIVPDDDAFPLLATYCVFAIHTCVVRHEAVERVGGFDTSLRTCEDWDLWQRIARAGGRFAHVPEHVALYHLSATSASADPARLLTDGLLVSARGHGPDPRLSELEQAYPNGAPARGLASAQIMLACWSAGLAIAEARDPLPFLDSVAHGPAPDIDAERVGTTLYESAVRLQPPSPAEIAEQWDTFGPRVLAFLEVLELRMSAPGLVRRALRTIEHTLVLDCPEHRPVVVGETYAARIDLTERLSDLACPTGTDRAVLTLTAEGSTMGVVELPVVDGVVPAEVIGEVDAAAAWRLLGLFFARTVYPDLRDGPDDEAMLHDSFGWTVFLQELWGRDGWTEDAFYDPRTADRAGPERPVEDQVELDVVDELPTLVTAASSVAVTLRVGGRTLGVVDAAATEGRIAAQQLRARLTAAAGFELCRLAVAQALVGRSLDGGDLRERLRERADERALPAIGGRSLLGRHPYAPLGTSGTRRAWLPATAAGEIALLAAAAGQPYRRGLQRAGIVYAPDIIGTVDLAREPNGDGATTDARIEVAAYGRHHFEELLASGRDPWQYESAYERRKYEHTLELIPSKAKRALEIGCAEGHFTVDLAPRVAELVAADVSEIALARARVRCAELGNVTFEQLDLAEDQLPGRFDLIVCSELLYYVGRERLPGIAAKLARGLQPGGALILAHANLQVDEPCEPGFDWALPYGAQHIGAVLGRQPSLRLVRELRTPYYRVQRYERRRVPARLAVVRRSPAPENVPYDEPIDEVAAHFRWSPAPGTPRSADERAETWHLPILMYHRIADEGPEALSRWRVDTAAFARQLEYLADAGFRTVTLDEWRAAAERRAPLPGNAVVLTFDDGYADFAANAWPLLQRHDFGAIVALVTDRVGGAAEWDAAYGEPAALLDWPEIRDLARDGVEFASHAVTHTPLTALTLDDAARECARSRVVLERELGRTVSTIVYPHGAHDPVVDHIAGGLGYVYGLSTEPGVARFRDRLLTLPRREIAGDLSFGEFVRALAADD
jgi:peptidoglycan/xylan/chitin deacetylase (PgdA/CDA1 family)/GT2 family glycosyltransferase/2-polyprenyl-3-methyl-5-hydroxy-6-metoxy-1,4-benzoquinol methylase